MPDPLSPIFTSNLLAGDLSPVLDTPAIIVIPIPIHVKRPCSVLLRPLHLLPPQAHTGGRAAVHVDDLAGDEVGGVGGEEGGRGGDVLRITDPPRGDQGV